MTALLVLALVPALMWLGQTALLRAAGLPFHWRLSARELPRRFKRINRALTHASFLVALLAYPLVRGVGPLAYYARLAPLDGRLARAALGGAAAVLYLVVLYLAWLLSDNVRFRVRHGAGRLLRRLATVPLTAILIALVEELLFRALLLAALIESLGVGAAVPVGALIFAGAHYVRTVKRYWTFPGHVALGLLLCTAFALTGDIWLSFGLHAGGVLVLMTVRPLIRYLGPAWLIGASIFPYAGAAGLIGLGLLTLNLLLWRME